MDRMWYVVVKPDGVLALPAVFSTATDAETAQAVRGITGAVLPVAVDPHPGPCPQAPAPAATD